MPKKISKIEEKQQPESENVNPDKLEYTKSETSIKIDSSGTSEIAVPKAITVKTLRSKADHMKDHLDRQPKVAVLIPFEKGEKKGAVQPFCINGYKFTVQKGVMTQVPEQVAEMIAERFNIETSNRDSHWTIKIREQKTH